MVAEIFRYDCSHIMLSLNDDDDDAKALPTGVPKDDAMKKGGWGGQNVSKSDGVILVCSLINSTIYFWFFSKYMKSMRKTAPKSVAFTCNS